MNLFWKNLDSKINDKINKDEPIQNLYTYLLENNKNVDINRVELNNAIEWESTDC